MRTKEASFIFACIAILILGGFFLLPKVFKEFKGEEVIRVRVTLENRCTITDDAFVVLDDGEIERAQEEMVMISDCNQNPRMDNIMKSMREAFSSKEDQKDE